jgi:AcrR family transcriptional regulator
MTSSDQVDSTPDARPKSRGGRNTLTKRRIVTAAMSLIADEGIEVLTMRRLGASLGVDPAAFYRHFPDKAALLRAIGRAAIAEVDIPVLAEEMSWAEWVLRTRTDYCAVLAERPFIVPLILDGLIPWQSLPAYAIERRLMLREGFAEQDVHSVVEVLEAFVVGWVAVANAVTRSPQAATARGYASSDQVPSDFHRGLRALLRGLRAELIPAGEGPG